MASNRELRTRIRSVRNIRQITKAMEVVSSVKLRGARSRVLAGRPYANKITEIAQNLALSASEEKVPLLQRRQVRNVGLAVVGSNKGLCGGFNNAVCARALAFIQERKDLEIQLFLFGKKVIEFFRARRYTAALQNVEIMARPRYDDAMEAAERILASYLNADIDELYLLHHEFRGTAHRALRLHPVLPVPIDPAAAAAPTAYIFEPKAEQILNDLLPRYFFNRIWVMIMESYAAEQLARMHAMNGATRNATDLIDRLTHEYHKARQASITKELLEIVGGAQALE